MAEEQNQHNGSSTTISSLAETVKAIQDELKEWRNGATNSGVNPMAGSKRGVTNSDNNPPADTHNSVFEVSAPAKRPRISDSDKEELEDEDEQDKQELLVPLSEAASTFLEAAFKTRLDNTTRRAKIKKFGVPDSRWTKCLRIDPAVTTNISKEAERGDRLVSRLQQFWLDAVGPLVMVLEKADEFVLPPEAVNMIQTSLQLMGNGNYHHSSERRKILLQHLNPQLKQLVEESDFKEAPPILFGENFGSVAKQKIEAAAALKKTLAPDKGKWSFRGSYPLELQGWQLCLLWPKERLAAQGEQSSWEDTAVKEMTRCRYVCEKFIKSCYTCSSVGGSSTSYSITDRVHGPINQVPSLGWKSGTFSGQLAGVNSRPVGLTNRGWLPIGIASYPISGQASSADAGFTRGTDPNNARGFGTIVQGSNNRNKSDPQQICFSNFSGREKEWGTETSGEI